MIGETGANGTVRLHGLTHQLIADYTGTSREVVTMEMIRLRRMNAIAYGRQYIDIHKEAMFTELRNEGHASFCPDAEEFRQVARAGQNLS
jgi:hypothetical protein